jgi:hypothetical protein
MTPRFRILAGALAIASLAAVAAAQSQAPETISATATVKRGGASLTAPVTVTVDKYATEAEVAAVRKAGASGSEALRKALSGMPDAGSIQIGERRTPLKFAVSRSTGSGRLVTVLTAEPIIHLGAGLPAAKPVTGFDVAIGMLVVDAGGGSGELAPAAKVGLDKDGAIVIEDYGHTVVWLNGLAAKTKAGTR